MKQLLLIPIILMVFGAGLLIIPPATISMRIINKRPLEKRHFLIGYVGTKDESKVWTGGYDTTMHGYPNLYEMVDFFQKKYDITKCRILGITEMSEVDYKTFWEYKRND